VRGTAHEVHDGATCTWLRERQELNVVDIHLETVLFALEIHRVDAAIWDDGPPHRQTWRAAPALADDSGGARGA
jgi:hypothetical protein